jgi:hypothetical protein
LFYKFKPHTFVGNIYNMKKVALIQSNTRNAKSRCRLKTLNNKSSLLNNIRVIDLWEFGLIGKIKQEFEGVENSLKPKNITE